MSYAKSVCMLPESRRHDSVRRALRAIETQAELSLATMARPNRNANVICASAEELAAALTDPEYALTKVVFVRNDGSQALTRQGESYSWLRSNGRPEELSIECQNPKQPRDSTSKSAWGTPIGRTKRFENGNINLPINTPRTDGSQVRTPAWRQHPDNKILDGFLDKSGPAYHACKPSQLHITDLSTSKSFAAAGAPYSITDRHCDQHAVITTVRCEFGLKYWIFWGPLSKDQRRAASAESRRKKHEPEGTYFNWLEQPHCGLLLRPGDEITMPPLTPHIAISLEPTLLVGWMTWRAPMMLSHLDGIQWLRSNLDESNDGQVEELFPKLYRLCHFMMSGCSLINWGPSKRVLIPRLQVIRLLPPPSFSR